MTMPEQASVPDGPGEGEPPEGTSQVVKKPRKAMFSASRRLPTLSAECAARQGGIASLAFECLGGREAAIRFLNEPHANLGGRPLDLAIADAQGFTRVAEVMRAFAIEPTAAR